VGFQAQGTTGRRIVDGAKQVRVFREDIAVRAKVFTIGALSAHADQDDLLDWIGHFESRPRVFVIHGETKASETLAKEIQARYGLTAHVPKWQERLVLKTREVAFEKAAKEETQPDLQRLALNTVIDLEKGLKDLSKRIESKEGALGEDEVDRLAYLREEIQAILSKP
jgi:metallo-beta-lactamase family protein